MVDKRILSGRVVKYVGTANDRVIDAAAWSDVGASGQKKVVWDRSNRWQVPVEDLTDEAVRYCDEDDDGFVLTEHK